MGLVNAFFGNLNTITLNNFPNKEEYTSFRGDSIYTGFYTNSVNNVERDLAVRKFVEI